MIDNVVSITKYKKAEDKFTFMRGFEMPADALLMDFPMQLELLKDRCWSMRNEGNPAGINIHRLLGLAEKMFANICFSLDEPLFMRVYEDPKDQLVFMVRVLSSYMFEMREQIKGGPEAVPILEANLYFFEMSGDNQEYFTEPPSVYAGEVIDVSEFPSEFFGRGSEQVTERIIKNMNKLTITNCGFAKIVNSTYVAVIPHSEKYCILMTLCLNDKTKIDGVVQCP